MKLQQKGKFKGSQKQNKIQKGSNANRSKNLNKQRSATLNKHERIVQNKKEKKMIEQVQGDFEEEDEMLDEQEEDEEDLAFQNSQHEDANYSQEEKFNIADQEQEQLMEEKNAEDVQPEESQEKQQLEEQDQNQEEKEISQDLDILAENEGNLEQYQEELGNKGVVYMSRIPPFMTPNYVRKLLQQYDVERIYLLPESDWARNNRIKKGGNKRICFREGWIEFNDKKIAKIAALSLNGQKMMQKKGNFYSDDLWNLKYLPKFKWHNLTEKLAHEERLKKERLRLQLEQERKVQEYYSTQVQKSKTIGSIVKKKEAKGKQVVNKKERKFGQMAVLKDQNDQEQ